MIAGAVHLSGKSSPLASIYHVYRRDRESADFSEIGQGFASLPLVDNTALTSSKSYCYKISFEDICGNRSDESGEICPVLLKAETNDGITEFNWTSLEGWQEGPSRYELVRKAVATFPELPVFTGSGLGFTLNGQDKTSKEVTYQIRVLPSRSDLYPGGSLSNEVVVVQESRMRFPDTFTPNNDGPTENEVFRCYCSFIKTYQLVIFNSWGNVVFSTDNPKDSWDGKVDGQPAQTGNYAYRAIAVDEAGKKLEKAGFIALLR